MSEGETEGRRIPLDWRISEDVKTRCATNFVVQHTDHEFLIYFFEAHPPFLFGSPKEVQAQLEQVESVPAECVARISIAPGRMPAFIEVLQTNLERYHSDREE